MITERTFLVCLTPWHDGGVWDYAPVHPARDEAWQSFLVAVDDAASRAATPAELASLLPDPAPRVAGDLAALHDPVTGPAAQASSLRADAGGPPMANLPGCAPGEAPIALDFHIANNRYPRSFLAEPAWLAGDLLGMVELAEANGFTAIGTTSWLNENPRWLAAFPPQWTHRRGPAHGVGPHLGNWGQLLTARQTLSQSAVADVRRTGQFRYQMRTTWAWTGEIRAWLT